MSPASTLRLLEEPLERDLDATGRPTQLNEVDARLGRPDDLAQPLYPVRQEPRGLAETVGVVDTARAVVVAERDVHVKPLSPGD